MLKFIIGAHRKNLNNMKNKFQILIFLSVILIDLLEFVKNELLLLKMHLILVLKI